MVVEVVEVRPAVHHAIEAAVATGWGQRRVLGVEEEVQGVAGHDEVDEHDRKVEQVLHGVHGQPRPRPGVLVQMVQILRMTNGRRSGRQVVKYFANIFERLHSSHTQQCSNRARTCTLS